MNRALLPLLLALGLAGCARRSAMRKVQAKRSELASALGPPSSQQARQP